tara:strand:- start:49 stop:780 length:732 start_codon:yes stop_codon:yes gene_type:complete
MKILPAIDLKDGKCVRLSMGDYNQVKNYDFNPLELANNWVDSGVKNLHIVDLDGAKDGELSNFVTIKTIREKNPHLYIQVGGGIRSISDIKKYLDIGLNKVIIGTKAMSDPTFLSQLDVATKDKVIIDMAVKDGNIAIQGWNESSTLDIDGFISYIENQNVKEIVLTDVSKDGMLSGINFNLINEVSIRTTIPIIASGGVTTLDDINKLILLGKQGVSGVIIGKAIYENHIKISDLITLESKL